MGEGSALQKTGRGGGFPRGEESREVMTVNTVKALGALALLAAGVAPAADGTNLLKNAGFESALEPAWERRTPDDAQRKTFRAEAGGRSGGAAVLENLAPAYTRLRQGQDRSIAVAPGSLLELSAWVRSELDTNGAAMVQIYCLGDKGEILAQPISAPIRGACDWTRRRVRTQVPDGTAYVMAYLQIRDGAGKVWFDDAELAVKRPPQKQEPRPAIALLTDLPETNAVLLRARTLFGDGLKRAAPEPAALQGSAGALALYEGSVPPALGPALEAFARGGGRVFMDMRAFARSRGAEAAAASVGDVKSPSLATRMQAGLRVLRASDVTAGFAVGQIMPRAGWPDGKLFVLPPGLAIPGLEVLAVAPGGEAGLVRLAVGAGSITACDLLSLREPHCRNVDAYCAFTPVSAALGNPVRFGHYYPRRLNYDGVVEEMKRLAAVHPAVIRVEEEGPASEPYRLWSLNLGKPGAPLYFLYAAAHGSEWEPGYGLMTFARLVAEGKMRDAVDLEKVQIKIIPLLNPSGYERMRRQNAQGVDLNRQGDLNWERFAGKDSNKDGLYGPHDYDWKGTAPFSEPETQVYRKIVGRPELYCLLDYHGNSGARDNKLGFTPFTGHPDNELMALEVQRIANARLRGRHLLRQSDEEAPSPYLLDVLRPDGDRPMLINSGARDRFGLLIELTAGYPESYGTVLQTDVTCELCRALFLAYPPPAKWPRE